MQPGRMPRVGPAAPVAVLGAASLVAVLCFWFPGPCRDPSADPETPLPLLEPGVPSGRKGMVVRSEMASMPLANTAAPPKEPSLLGMPAGGSASQTQLVWSRKVLTEPVDLETLAAIISQGKAEILEDLVDSRHRPSLEAELLPIRQTMEQVATRYVHEVSTVKSLLIDNPARVIRIRSQPRERDPSYVHLATARSQITGKSGAVWGDIDKRTGDEVHFIVLWAEWPQLRELVDAQVVTVKARQHVLRNWITTQFYLHGPSLFVPGSIHR